MGDGSLSLLVLIGAGFLILKPTEVPVFARNAGRIVGLTVRGLRRVRDIADDAIQRSATASANNPDLTAMRTQMQSSLDQFSDLASTVRRDMSGVPIFPATFIRSKFRSAALQSHQFHRQQQQHKTVNPSQNSSMMSPMGSPQAVQSEDVKQRDTSSDVTSQKDSEMGISHLQHHITRTSSASTGADIIARSIEEAALAGQYRKWFPSSKQNEHSNEHQEQT